MFKKGISFIFIGAVLLLFSNGLQAQEMQSESLDIRQLNNILTLEGSTQNGAYKIKIPQNDLNISVDGFKIIPPMGATSWVAFTPAPEGAWIMGDIVVTEDELGAVEAELFRQGLHATALHKHFLGEEPRVMYMHVGGSGDQEELARSVRAVLDKIETLRGGDPAKASTSPVENTLNTEAIANIIGHEGSTTDGVFKISIGRPDVHLEMSGKEHEGYEEEHEEHGEESDEHKEHHENEDSEVHVTAFTGFNTWAAFQGTPEKAAVAGDFAMRAGEVEPVIKTLVENVFKVVSLHNHMIDEHPRIFFLHYWGTGNAQELAKGLREALNQTGKMERHEDEEMEE
jgi:hypothetical protein